MLDDVGRMRNEPRHQHLAGGQGHVLPHLPFVLLARIGGLETVGAEIDPQHEIDNVLDRQLMPGLIAHSTNVVEHPDLVAERLLRYADIVGRDSVMAGTDCGFSQSPLAGRVHRSIMWAKLKCLAEGAAIASKLLWH